MQTLDLELALGLQLLELVLDILDDEGIHGFRCLWGNESITKLSVFADRKERNHQPNTEFS